jgi:hypothetical protein
MAGRRAPRCDRPVEGIGSERLLAALGGETTEVGLVCWVLYDSGVILGCWVLGRGPSWGGKFSGGLLPFLFLIFLIFHFEKKIERFGGFKRF